MSLQDEIDRARSDIKTDGYAMSIGEWLNLYSSQELNIHPEFQRFFRWGLTQKSRFIESLLLGIPVPPIFVSQREDGVWDVVDGLQRLSTIFEFAGVLLGEDGALKNPLQLGKTKYLPALEGKFWEVDGDDLNSFTPTQRMLIKRTKIGVSIILKESDPQSKFELFQRLNTGGSQLSEQEVRNCLLVMIDPGFYRWLSELASYTPFRDSIALTDRALSEQYDLEIVLRFLVFRRLPETRLGNIGEVGDFLTDQMVILAMNPDYNRNEEGIVFRGLFDFIGQTLGADAFRRWVPDDQRFKGGFLVSAFEAVSIGMGYWMPEHIADPAFTQNVKSVWSKAEFIGNSGSGVRASSRIPETIALGRELFQP